MAPFWFWLGGVFPTFLLGCSLVGQAKRKFDTNMMVALGILSVAWPIMSFLFCVGLVSGLADQWEGQHASKRDH